MHIDIFPVQQVHQQTFTMTVDSLIIEIRPSAEGAQTFGEMVVLVGEENEYKEIVILEVEKNVDIYKPSIDKYLGEVNGRFYFLLKEVGT